MQQRIQVPGDKLPLRIVGVEIEGIEHSSTQIPVSFLQVLNDCRSVQDLGLSLKVITQYMMETGLYRDVKFAVLPQGDEDSPSDIRVYCKIEEKGRFNTSISVSQSIDNSSSAIGSFTGTVRNPINGLGESLDITLATDAKGKQLRSVEVRLKDLYNTPQSQVKYHAAVSRSELCRKETSGFSSQTDSIIAGVSTKNGVSRLEYEAAFRKATPHNADAGIVGQTYTPNTKHSLRYLRVEDTRDYPFNPYRGTYYRSASEVSGFAGDYTGLSSQFSFQHHIPLSDMMCLSLTARGGVAQPLRNVYNILFGRNPSTVDDFDPDFEIQDVPIYDRFYPDSLYVRGLKIKEYGPRCGKHVYGADAFASFTASLSSFIPGLETLPIKPHVFVNHATMASVSTMLRQKYGGGDFGCTTNYSQNASMGVGLVFPTFFGRLEVNYAKILGDGIKSRPMELSFGAAIDW